MTSWLHRIGLLAAALALIVLAVPRLVAAIIDLPGDRVAFALRHDQAVSDQALEALMSTRRSAIEWNGDARRYRDLSLAADMLSVRRGDDQELGSELIDTAERAVVAGLSLAPVDSYSWARLATIRWRRDDDSRAVAGALRASIETGAFDPRLTPARANLVIRLWPDLDAGDRQLFAGQIRSLWQDDPATLVASVTDPGAFVAVAAALGNPADIEALLALRSRISQEPR